MGGASWLRLSKALRALVAALVAPGRTLFLLGAAPLPVCGPTPIRAGVGTALRATMHTALSNASGCVASVRPSAASAEG